MRPVANGGQNSGRLPDELQGLRAPRSSGRGRLEICTRVLVSEKNGKGIGLWRPRTCEFDCLKAHCGARYLPKSWVYWRKAECRADVPGNSHDGTTYRRRFATCFFHTGHGGGRARRSERIRRRVVYQVVEFH